MNLQDLPCTLAGNFSFYCTYNDAIYGPKDNACYLISGQAGRARAIASDERDWR
jgi:hypothetical protein